MLSAALFATCVVDVMTPEVGVAAVRVLRAAGCRVSFPSGQTCCGQPAWNAGFAAEAAAVAGTSLEALERDSADVVVVPAGSCATMIRLYWPTLFELAGAPADADRARNLAGRTRELTELLATLDVPTTVGPPAGAETVAYHHGCHMTRELHLRDEPLGVLERAGCRLAPWDADRCCGFGGTFSVTLPETSAAMADEKLDSLPEGVTTVVGSDPSCLLQLRARAEVRGLPVRTRHVAEVLEAALGSPAPSDG